MADVQKVTGSYYNGRCIEVPGRGPGQVLDGWVLGCGGRVWRQIREGKVVMMAECCESGPGCVIVDLMRWAGVKHHIPVELVVADPPD